jgi:exosortase
MNSRTATLCVLWALALVVCWPAARAALNLGLHDDRYVQIVAAPLICAFLIYWERRRIFKETSWDGIAGIPLFSIALSLCFVALRRPAAPTEGGALSFAILSLSLTFMAGFLLCYGRRSFSSAFFPLCYLLLAVPIPAWVMDKITFGLQQGSATLSYHLLRSVGVPVFGEGMRLSLPGLEIEVAPECSGIRSCLAFTLLALVAGRLCLRTGWSRLALVISILPMAVLKNAIRISAIAVLSAYVDPAVMHSPIHHYGGVIFTPLGVAFFVACLSGLRRFEAAMSRRFEEEHTLVESVGTGG